MTYLGELRINWRWVAAACVGLGSGFGLNQYVAGTFADHLIREFHWSKSQFALTGLTIIVSMLALPIAGRLTDPHPLFFTSSLKPFASLAAGAL